MHKSSFHVMSFLLDPFLAFMLGIIFSFFTKGFNFSKKITFVICSIVISLATSYSILLYLNVVKTDFLILDSFAKILPIEQQVGPRIMLHSNASGVTKDLFPLPVVVIFYALYFVWFYLGFKTTRQLIQPSEPTPQDNSQTNLYIRIVGILVFVSAGMMLFFFIMIPLDDVVVGEFFGAKSILLQHEATIKGYMASPNAKFSGFSDNLCNPDKIGAEMDPPRIVQRDSEMIIVANQLQTVSVSDITVMCQARKDIGENAIFFFVNLSTWMFLIAMFLVARSLHQKSRFWDYGVNEK